VITHVVATLAVLAAQQAQPLRKSDLIRLLSGSTFSQDEIAGMVRRTCLSFAPSGRDRADFTALGASAAVLKEIDTCARRAEPRPAAAPPRRDTTHVPKVVSSRPAPVPVAPPVAPPRVIVADAAHSGWTATREHGVAAQRLSAPLVFTARDASGAPLAAAAVTLTATNATPDAASVLTDNRGRAAVGVTFGTKALPAVISATVGAMTLPDTILPAIGAPAQLALSCGGQTLAGLLVLSVGARTALEVRPLDSFGTAVAADSVAVAAADERVLRVGVVTPASGGATVALDPRGGGTTVLTISAAGLKRSLTAAVLSDPVRGVVPCPG